MMNYLRVRDSIYKKHKVMIDKMIVEEAIRICDGDIRLIMIELSDLIEKEKLGGNDYV